jgi:(5-formylfuran-3-yl)methyl phosphate synthase
MQLLVSVRSEAEVAAALSGGADIIDAKDPSRGSLGRLSTPVLMGIVERIPASVGLSIALGDVSRRGEVFRIIASLPEKVGSASCYIKLGFAGIYSSHRVGVLLEEACTAARQHSVPLRVVAVAYADAELARTIAPEHLCRVAAQAGVSGVLVDTHGKGAGSLLSRMTLTALADFVGALHRDGLLAAVAGSLQAEHLPLVGATRPDIVGVRGAACTGGRDGTVSRLRVARLRRAIDRTSSVSVRPHHPGIPLGETPQPPAKLSPIR